MAWKELFEAARLASTVVGCSRSDVADRRRTARHLEACGNPAVRIGARTDAAHAGAAYVRCMWMPAARTGWVLTTVVEGERETREDGGAHTPMLTRLGSSAIAGGNEGLVALVGWMAIVFSTLYFVSDLIELMQGGFSTTQLVLTYAAESAIPLFVLGLYALQRPPDRSTRTRRRARVCLCVRLLHEHGHVRDHREDE